MSKLINVEITGWHLAGQHKKIHFLIGQPHDDIGWYTLCNQHINGVSTDVLTGKNYDDYKCKTCLTRMKGRKCP